MSSRLAVEFKNSIDEPRNVDSCEIVVTDADTGTELWRSNPNPTPTPDDCSRFQNGGVTGSYVFIIPGDAHQVHDDLKLVEEHNWSLFWRYGGGNQLHGTEAWTVQVFNDILIGNNPIVNPPPTPDEIGPAHVPSPTPTSPA